MEGRRKRWKEGEKGGRKEKKVEGRRKRWKEGENGAGRIEGRTPHRNGCT